MKRDLQHILRIIVRWALISCSLSALLFVAAGTTQILSLKAYVVVFSAVLLITMLAVDPQLAHERVHPNVDLSSSHLRSATGCLWLLTLILAGFSVGRMPTHFAVPMPIRWFALVAFVISSSLQVWAMIVNPFFSPLIRIQSERGHHLIAAGPYRYIRHPGYLAMCISVPASAVAIGSWLALVPAVGFIVAIRRRAQLEDQFLRKNLPGYTGYANRVPLDPLIQCERGRRIHV
jgi:protein-S-isoprenylcysteine O-methyltransferase Ste14